MERAAAIEDNFTAEGDSQLAANGAQRTLSLQIDSTTDITGSCSQCGAGWEGEPALIQVSLGQVADDLLLFAVRPNFSLREVTDEFQKRLIVALLRQTGGRVKPAATLAQMKYTTFYTMLRRLGIEPEDMRPSANGRH